MLRRPFSQKNLKKEDRMKTKKIGKKLVINKQTVANLKDVEMKESKGGSAIGCPTWHTYSEACFFDPGLECC